MTNKIEKIMKTIEMDHPNMPSDNLLIKVQIDNNNLDKFETFLNNKVKVMLTEFYEKEKAVSIYDYALPKFNWLCVTCGETISNTNIQCSKCGSFRVVESFPNLIDNPMNAGKEEIALLQKRRQLEREIVCGRDLLTTDIIEMDSSLYIISKKWLTQWKSFVFNKPCKDSRLSPNSSIGVLPPGPIDNHCLMHKDRQTIKKGLHKVLSI